MNACPLTPKLVCLLETAVRLRTTESKPLACALGVTPNTVRTHFYRACDLLGVETRFAAVMLALQAGWITLP